MLLSRLYHNLGEIISEPPYSVVSPVQSVVGTVELL